MTLTDEQAFYITCGLMCLIGLLWGGVGALVARRSEAWGERLSLFGLACFGTGLLMALIGPRV